MTETSMSLQVHQALRRKIMLGEFLQGEPLSEVKLAESLEVSRVPVREAMPLLHQEGLIETTPRRRAVVSTWTAQRIHDLFDARLGVEVAAAGAAARRLGVTGDVSALELMMAHSEAELDEDHPLEVALINTEVHVAFVAASGNALLDELMRVLSGRMAWLFYLTSGRDLQGQNHEHHALLDAVRDGNVRLAESLMYAHIETGRAPTLTALGLE